MSAHQLATGHLTPQGGHNPIFWALILLHCLEASQTEITIVINTFTVFSSTIVSTAEPTSPPISRRPEEATRSGFSAVARQYQIHEVLFTKVSIWHQRDLLRGWGAGDIILHLMNRRLWWKCASENQSPKIVYHEAKLWSAAEQEELSFRFPVVRWKM